MTAVSAHEFSLKYETILTGAASVQPFYLAIPASTTLETIAFVYDEEWTSLVDPRETLGGSRTAVYSWQHRETATVSA